jgi:4-diphosphocytidyl-2-C-methyl-D-erythritol kinase
MIRELAPAKVNLVLHVGPKRGALHEVASLFASVDGVADVVEVEAAEADSVACEGVTGPNLAEAALRAFRSEHPELPPLRVAIEKHIPVAAGMAGGSADAAAVLRAANRIAGEPFDSAALRRIAAPLGSDVPSQVEPGHAIVSGTGEVVEPVELPRLLLGIVPDPDGLSTATVFAEAERLGLPRARLDLQGVRDVAVLDAEGIAAGLENDLQEAALSLRPGLRAKLDALRGAGALGALVSGSGPTVYGVFADPPVPVPPGMLVTMVAGR